MKDVAWLVAAEKEESLLREIERLKVIHAHRVKKNNKRNVNRHILCLLQEEGEEKISRMSFSMKALEEEFIKKQLQVRFWSSKVIS
jgi:hypothetical protein